ncbi:MAG: peptide ABC transporter permease, partial [Acidobacteriota bacterium]
MRTRLAWHDLLHRRARTLAALLGVVFAITLLFMQAGFYQACRDSAVRVHGLLAYDLLLTSPSYTFIVASGQIPRERLAQAEAVDGVRDAIPLRVGGRLW